MGVEIETPNIKLKTKLGDIYIRAHPLDNCVRIMVEQGQSFKLEYVSLEGEECHIFVDKVKITQIFTEEP